MKIAVTGCLGRMGRMLLAEVEADDRVTLVGGVDISMIGSKITDLIACSNKQIAIHASLEEITDQCDAVIDFSTPSNMLTVAEICHKYKKILVSGTTGYTNEQKSLMQRYAQDIPIVLSGNMSIGVNAIVSILSDLVTKLGKECDAEIVDIHHKYKVDSPSGTALLLGQEIAKAYNQRLEQLLVTDKRFVERSARKQGDIGISSVRCGNIVGEHRVILATEGEKIEIVHTAYDRNIFVKGAIRACIWAQEQTSGFFDMQDVMSGNTSVS